MIYDELWIDVNKFETGYNIAARQNEELAQIKIYVTSTGRLIDNTKYTCHFMGNNFRGELTDGIAEVVDTEEGCYIYTFSKENLSVAGKFKLAYFRLFDSSGKPITSCNFTLDVKREADMQADQAAIHVTLLDEILDKYDKNLEAQKNDFEEYSTTQKEEWNTFVEQNKEVINSIDPNGKVLTELVDSRKPAESSAFDNLGDRLDKQFGVNSEFRPFENQESFMRRVFHENSERGLNVKWFGAKGDGVTDDTAAIQDTIDYIRTEWLAGRKKTNTVMLPHGLYLIKKTIELPPYIKMNSFGSVVFLYDGTDVKQPCLHIKWHGEDPVETYSPQYTGSLSRKEWQRGPILNGNNGGISFAPKVGNKLNLTAIEIGARNNEDRVSGWKCVARSGIENISIDKFYVGIQVNPLDFYLFDFVKCNIEANNINVQFGGGYFTGTAANTGENIYFEKCILASATEVCINQIHGGMDCMFQECGIDFNALIFKGGAYPNNSNIIIAGNLEGNNKIADFKGAVSTGWRNTLMISKAHLLMHKTLSQAPVIEGKVNLIIDDIYNILTDNNGTNEKKGQLLNYVCDDEVRILKNSSFLSGRVNRLGYLWQEKENFFYSGKNLKNAGTITPYRNIFELVENQAVDADLRNIGLTSSYKMVGGKNYDGFTFDQKIDIPTGARFVRVYLVQKIKSTTAKTLNHRINVYGADNQELEMNKNPFNSVLSSNGENSINTHILVFEITRQAKFLKFSCNVGGFDNTSDYYELGYVYIDFA